MCGNYEDADDALVEALLKAHKACFQLKDPEAFGGWLATIARRACARIKKREALRPVMALNDATPESERMKSELLNEQHLTKMCIHQALEDMPKIYRDAYIKRDLEGLDAEAAAKELNVSIPALRSRHFRARTHLQRALDGSIAFRRP